jgi:monofunctional biosynthetic peptidoglycan transglycosylase
MNSRRWIKWLLITPVILLLLPVVLIASMRWTDPVTSMFMLQRQYALWQADVREKIQYEWVDAEHISHNMMLAVVAAEDQKFPVHFGFDLEAIEKAMTHNRGSKKTRGASTITQQVAKNLFLWPSRSWLRKGMEVYLTALMEVFWSKQRIVEVYVNIAQFDDNLFGVGAASKQFFKKSPDKLTMREAALLAAVLPNPHRYRVARPSEFVMKRVYWIQQQMYGLGNNYIATGVVPVKHYQASVASAADGVVMPVEELVEEPIDVLIDEPMSSAEDANDTPDMALPGADATETINVAAEAEPEPVVSESNLPLPTEIVPADVNSLP